jgi:tRNA threonylcarbamoyladenosine biosynthesis protein TsaE
LSFDVPSAPARVIPRPGEVLTHTSRSTRGTRALAVRIARKLERGAVVALAGELGAGKTAFVQGLAAGLEVPELTQVLSPTYTLVNEYLGGRAPLVHVDFYRLGGESAARALGLDEQIGRADAITAVEWADLFPELLPPSTIWIELVRAEGNARRLLVSTGRREAGPRS